MHPDDQKMNITAAQYTQDADGNITGIAATIEGQQMQVPIDKMNRYYDELIHQDDIDMITILDAE